MCCEATAFRAIHFEKQPRARSVRRYDPETHITAPAKTSRAQFSLLTQTCCTNLLTVDPQLSEEEC